MISLRPKVKINYITKMTKEEVLEQLSQNIDQDLYSFSFNRKVTDKPFRGTLNESGFAIEREINYRNSFLPKITGEIKEEANYTRISVIMKLSMFVFIFLLFWTGGVFAGCIASIYATVLNGFEVFYLIPFVMLFFMCSLTIGAFRYEANKGKTDLQKILQAEFEE